MFCEAGGPLIYAILLTTGGGGRSNNNIGSMMYGWQEGFSKLSAAVTFLSSCYISSDNLFAVLNFVIYCYN
jgi:hypothetical protein